MDSMTVIDKNKWLVEPSAHDLTEVVAEGAYLRLTYLQKNEEGVPYRHRVTIYLNDQGREVLRTNDCYSTPQPEPETVPLTRWQKICSVFNLSW